MFKVDLHTHSNASPDGGLSKSHYDRAFSSGLLDCAAITDHNRIENALALQHAFGESRIIVGAEIMTGQGAIIGLFLTKPVLVGLSPLATVRAIKEQGGIVYIPHPFETMRRGLSESALSEIADFIDVVEVHNGRAWLQNRGPRAAAWASLHHKVRASSSDAHGYRGLGSGVTLLEEIPHRDTFLQLMGKARLLTRRPHLRSLFYPKLHRLGRRLRITSS